MPLTSTFAFGVATIVSRRSYCDFSTLSSFGDALGITHADLPLFASVAVLVVGSAVLLYKEVELTSVKPGHDAVIGPRAKRMRNLLLVQRSMVVTACVAMAAGAAIVLAESGLFAVAFAVEPLMARRPAIPFSD